MQAPRRKIIDDTRGGVLTAGENFVHLLPSTGFVPRFLGLRTRCAFRPVVRHAAVARLFPEKMHECATTFVSFERARVVVARAVHIVRIVRDVSPAIRIASMPAVADRARVTTRKPYHATTPPLRAVTLRAYRSEPRA